MIQMMTDAEYMRAARKRLGFTQAEAAAALGFKNRLAVTNIESGRSRLPGSVKKLLLIPDELRRLHFWATVAFYPRSAEMKQYAIKRYLLVHDRLQIKKL